MDVQEGCKASAEGVRGRGVGQPAGGRERATFGGQDELEAGGAAALAALAKAPKSARGEIGAWGASGSTGDKNRWRDKPQAAEQPAPER